MARIIDIFRSLKMPLCFSMMHHKTCALTAI